MGLGQVINIYKGVIVLSLASGCYSAKGDLTKEEINKLEDRHLQNVVGYVPLYKGDSVSEFLMISEKCLKYGCGANCTVEPCNKFVMDDIKLAYEIVKAFKTKLDSQYENIILMVMTATAICLSLYLWFVGHFSIRATWIYSVFFPDEEFQDPCQGIPMRLYTEMQFETLFNNEPRLKKIQKEEKKLLEKNKVKVDKSVQEFFHARPYLSKLENDPSVLANLMAMKENQDEDIEASSSSEDYLDEREKAEEAVHKYFNKQQEQHPGGEEKKEPRLKNLLQERERFKNVHADPSVHPMGLHHGGAAHHIHVPRLSKGEVQALHHTVSDNHGHPDHHHRQSLTKQRRHSADNTHHPPVDIRRSASHFAKR